MIRNYLLTAFRNLGRQKGHSFINITGLAVGMTVSLLIGLWVWDELSYNKDNRNYDHVARVLQSQNINGSIDTWWGLPYPTGEAIRQSYGNTFKKVAMSTWGSGMILSTPDKQLMKIGQYIEPAGPDILDLKMIKGSRNALTAPSFILISRSTARTYFGDQDPLGQILTLNNKFPLKVAGVFEDMPDNSDFKDLNFMVPWSLYLQAESWIPKMPNPWGMNTFQVFVQTQDNVDMTVASARIRDVKKNNVHKDELQYNPVTFLHPMSKWRLYSDYRNGVNAGGRIQYLRLFSIIGIFVLLLACINFMNLSTARSEHRAKEVGIRKVVGSRRRQLIGQFLSESLLVVMGAFALSLLLAELALPVFNSIADKKMSIPWNAPLFWMASLAFCTITGLVAGSYPALYLSSFRPVKVLKGAFKAGRFASIPRKVLVVLQFTISVTLIIGTIVVFREIQYAQDRPVGYNRNGLININLITPDIDKHFDAVRQELISSGGITDMAESSGPVTAVWSTNGGIKWKGKDPGLAVDIPNTGISYNYGKTVGWQFVQGRDFSIDFPTDSMGLVLNEAAVKFMGLKNPVGETVYWDEDPLHVIGVIKDMVMESPYEPVRPSMYCVRRSHDAVVILRTNPNLSTRQSLAKIESVFRKYSPAQPFTYQFVDDEYGKKFGNEQRIGTLASCFAILAIFISCLGLFGMASFMAGQRIREIGIRKVLGASIFNLWRLLSRDFVILVMLALLIAIPLSWFFMHQWLQGYQYRTGISWWIFAVTAAGALLITLLTVSYQAIRAALINPVRSLRSE